MLCCAVAGTVPASLGGLKKLQFLSLSRTGLSGDLNAYTDAIPTYPSSEQSFKQLDEDDTLNRGRKLLQGSTQEAPAAAADDPVAVAAPAPAKQAHSAAHTAAAQTPVAAAAAPAIEAVAAPAHTAGAAAHTTAPAHATGAAHTAGAAAHTTGAAHTAPAKAAAPIESDGSAAGAGAAVAVGAMAAAPVATTAAAAPASAATVATTAPAAMGAAATDTTAVTSTAAEATTPGAAPAATKSAATASTITAEPVAAPAAAPTKANAAAAAGGGAVAAAAVATDPSAVEPPVAGPGQGRTFPSLPEDQINGSMAVGHLPGPSSVQGALPVDNSMRAGDTAAQADYWRPDNLDMAPPPERPNSLLHVDLSNNHLTGTVPPAIYKMNMFADLAIAKDPMSRR